VTNTKTQETIDELDALTDVEDHLQFAANIIEREEISTALKSEIDSQINQIQKRRGDPNLYLAVIGEFSSGKSTFINALLRGFLQIYQFCHLIQLMKILPKPKQ